MEGTDVYLWLIHVVAQQEPTQHCKAISLQLKIKIFKRPGEYCRRSPICLTFTRIYNICH